MQIQSYLNALTPQQRNVRNLMTAVAVTISVASLAYSQDAPPLILHSAVGAGVADAMAIGGDTTVATNGKFFVGKLERVQKNSSKSVRWALMDADNQVAAFVAPTSKYDLRRFLGKEIGVSARTFSEPDGEPPYVLVDAITPMFASNWSKEDPAPESKNVLASHETPVAKKPATAQATHTRVVPAQQWESVVEPLPTVPGEIIVDGGCATGGCSNPTCNSCSTAYISNVPAGPATCGPPGWMWIRGENLQWWAKGMSAPPLITTSAAGTGAGNAGVLGMPSTDTLYGGDDQILTDSTSGFRIRFGGFFGPRRKIGYEGEFFALTSNEDEYIETSDANGNPILARPFFNMNPRVNGGGALDPPAREDAEIVAFPGLIRGTVRVNSYADFRGASGMFRFNKCCKQACQRRSCNGGCGGCCGIFGAIGRCGYPPFCRTDMLLGFQHYELNEGIRITEDLTSLDANNLGTFNIVDSFETSNEFNGAVFGTAIEGGINRWTLELLMRLSVGSVDQSVTINGETTISPLVTPAETFEGGLLAQRSNIGTYERSEFTMIPQLNANLGFYLTPHLRAIVGYSLIYWGNVLRPGDQIDLDLNPDLLPPEIDPFVGALRPGFDFHQSDYWVQGLNIGLDFRW